MFRIEYVGGPVDGRQERVTWLAGEVRFPQPADPSHTPLHHDRTARFVYKLRESTDGTAYYDYVGRES